ncbi:glycosyl hydrolases family 16-domain-containing protein, partial [Globomyces pollinis-pini]
AIDNTRYDFTIDYAVKQASVKNGVATLSLPKPGPNGEIQGTRMSSTRLLKYGKVTMQMRASTIPGIVSTFILMGGKLPDEYDAKSPNRKFGDEIDFEFLGQHPNIAETNVFYRNFPEFGARLQQLKVDDISKTHKYTIDWKPDVIDYAVDDVVLRSYRRDSPLANSPNINPGDRFFPNRPQKIQFGLWADPKNSWSGPLVFPPGVNEATVSYDFIDIQCYNDKGEPVDKWP